MRGQAQLSNVNSSSGGHHRVVSDSYNSVIHGHQPNKNKSLIQVSSNPLSIEQSKLTSERALNADGTS